ncbi:hypothetical protein [Dyella telluris]|uniref:Cytochrome-c oxidase n=1 Tax=Dyella telluris TaxID=2763498 RepID=A0A7G8Q647_9GAMM|nr:hypothetical protein [Dyella telluris]QNK02255.1 hypothetical protein H8F01_03590 [Dyella telluris]
MTDNTRSRAWFCMAVIYFVVAVALGLVMGGSGDHSLMAVHAHLNLLGWVSMSLFGLIGMAYPAITQGRMASWQFWLHNIGTPVMLGALAAQIKGVAGVDPLLGIASALVGLAAALFAWLVITRISMQRVTASAVQRRAS